MATLSRIAIDQIEVSTHTVPTDLPESDGTLEWNSTTLVLVRSHGGNEHGLGYTYADTGTATLIHDVLAGVVQGQDAMAPASSWNAMISRVRNLGRPGIVSMAIAAVDIALWDSRLKQTKDHGNAGEPPGGKPAKYALPTQAKVVRGMRSL